MASINDKLVNMETRLQQILEIAGNLKLRSEEGEPHSKQQRYDKRKNQTRIENKSVPSDVRLNRFLYIGSEAPLFQPGALTYKLVKSDVPSVEEMINKYKETKKNSDKSEKHSEEDIPVLVAISKALMNKNNPYPECAVFCLAICIRSALADEFKDEFKEAAYNVARRCFITFEELTMFVKHATSLHRSTHKEGKGSGGWGGGMRRLVVQWYNKQEPAKLARSVAHHGKQHLWAHRDLMKLSHFKPAETEVAMCAIVCYVLHSLEETEKKFGADPKAADVLLEFKQRKLELMAGKEELAKLIETHDLRLCDIPTSQLQYPEVWCALLNNMSTVDILTAMPSILRLRFSEAENIRKTAAEILSKEGATAPPALVYITLKNYLKCLKNKGHKFDSAYIQERKLKETFPVREECSTSVKALKTLLNNSLKAIEGNGVRTLVTVDLRETDQTCQWTHSVTPLEAAAFVSLCLARSNKIFVLTVFTEGKELQQVSVAKTATIESLLEEFKKLQATAKKQPVMTEPIDWAKERKRDYDVFVILTPYLKGWLWKDNNISKSLTSYRETLEKKNTKLAVCAFSNMTLRVSYSKNIGCLDLAGFHSNTLTILTNFCQGNF